jgi:hypothetical protein
VKSKESSRMSVPAIIIHTLLKSAFIKHYPQTIARYRVPDQQ